MTLHSADAPVITAALAIRPAGGSDGRADGSAPAGAVWRDIAIEPDRLEAWFTAELRQIADRGPAVEPATSAETSAEMALRAGESLLSGHAAGQPDALIHYSATLDENPCWSVASFLQHRLGLRAALAFSINQKGGSAGLAALRVAADMIGAEPGIRRVLLTGADKLVPPYPRSFAGLPATDGASAVLVARGGHGWRVCRVAFLDRVRACEDRAPLRMARIAALARLAQSSLDELALDARRIRAIVSPFPGAEAARLRAALAAPDDACLVVPADAAAPLSSGPLALLERLNGETWRTGDLALLCSYGFGTGVGCAVLEA